MTQSKSIHFGKVTIVGVGLIGASLGLALKRAGVVDAVYGVGRSKANLDQAIAMGAIDGVLTLAEAAFISIKERRPVSPPSLP